VLGRRNAVGIFVVDHDFLTVGTLAESKSAATGSDYSPRARVRWPSFRVRSGAGPIGKGPPRMALRCKRPVGIHLKGVYDGP
jgi:hypothetical protein